MKKTLVFLQVTLGLMVAGLVTGCSPFNKVHVRSGSLGFLQHQQVVNIEYRYDGLRVGQYERKSWPEQEHVAKKVAAAEAKNPGGGERWRQAWIGNRASNFEPKFESLLNKQLEESPRPLQFGKHPDAPFTLIVESQYLEPGWNAAIAARPALLTANANFVETHNRANTVARVSLVNMTGIDPMGFAFDEAWRMQESYAKAGKELGILLRKKRK
jgi:hypothetical protein